jgi:hypothetical protein
LTGSRGWTTPVCRSTQHLAPHFAGRLLANITTAEVRSFTLARQQAGASNGEINRDLAALKRMFSLAVKGGLLYAKPHIPMLQEDNVRKGFLEREGFEAVRRPPTGATPAGCDLRVLTGWRLTSEILPLEWRQVDMQAGEVRLDPGTTKNREGRTFPFTTELRALLEEQAVRRDALKARGIICPHVFFIATVSASETFAGPGPRRAQRQASPGASFTISDELQSETWNVRACRGPSPWPWWATRPKPFIGDTQSSTQEHCGEKNRLRRDPCGEPLS